jgi:hypothetical protein
MSSQEAEGKGEDLLQSGGIVRRLDSCDSLKELQIRLSDLFIGRLLLELSPFGLDLFRHFVKV